MRRMRRAPIYCFLIVVAVCASNCAGLSSHGVPDANAAAIFDGQWRLDASASDDVRARLAPLFDRGEKRWRRNAERFEDAPPHPDGGPQGSDDGISHIQWMRSEREKDNRSLIAMLVPASHLEIQHSDRSIRIATDKGEGTRLLTPGEESTLFLPAGGFSVSSSWEDGALRITSAGTGDNKVHVVELFKVRGETLEERLDIKIPGMGKSSFRMVYRR